MRPQSVCRQCRKLGRRLRCTKGGAEGCRNPEVWCHHNSNRSATQTWANVASVTRLITRHTIMSYALSANAVHANAICRWMHELPNMHCSAIAGRAACREMWGELAKRTFAVQPLLRIHITGLRRPCCASQGQTSSKLS